MIAELQRKKSTPINSNTNSSQLEEQSINSNTNTNNQIIIYGAEVTEVINGFQVDKVLGWILFSEL